MFDTVCTFPLSSDLFAQAVHPTEPVVSVGLSSGHVEALKLPPIDADDELPSGAKRRGSSGTDTVDTSWRTKRHKGSCRCLSYSVDGGQIYSAGTDGIVKAADSETGRVTGKVGIPENRSLPNRSEGIDAPTVIHALSPQTLLLSTDSGALHLFDLRDPAPSLPLPDTKTAFTHHTPSQTYRPHNDYISSLTPVPPSATSTSGYSKQFLTTGGTTLALTDLRRGVLAKSEDQEELLLSCLYITGLPVKKSSGSTGEKAVVGGGDGVITLWEKGQWDDQDERIIVSREKETLDSMAEIPLGICGLGKRLAVGMGDGTIRFVKLGANQIVGELKHDEVEGVSALAFDAGGRMISGGGMTVKVWTETMEGDDEEERPTGLGTKRSLKGETSEEDDDENDGNDSSEEEQPRKKRKKRKRGKGQNHSESSYSFAGLD